MIGFAQNTMAILIAAAIFSIGAVIARPGQETVTANLADPTARGTYFGVAALSLAVGGGLGNLLGGLAYDAGTEHDLQIVTWLLFATIGACSAVGIWFNRHRFGGIRELERLEQDATLDQPAHRSTSVPSTPRLVSNSSPLSSGTSTTAHKPAANEVTP